MLGPWSYRRPGQRLVSDFLEKDVHMPVSSVQALRKTLGFCLLSLGLAPWVVSAYTSVNTEVLLSEYQSWHTVQQGWFGGLATSLSLIDDATVLGPDGEVALGLDPGVLTVGIVGYDLGALRFGQEVAWHRARMNSITMHGMDTGVAGEMSHLRLLSRNRLAFRPTPGSPHAAYVSLGLGALKAKLEFEDPITGQAYDESGWAFVYEFQAGLVYKFMNDDRLRIGIMAANTEPQTKVLLDSWFNFRFSRRSPHRAYVGGSIGAVDSKVKDESLGYRLSAGMVFRVADRTGFGVDYRYIAMPGFTAHTPGISLRYNF